MRAGRSGRPVPALPSRSRIQDVKNRAHICLRPTDRSRDEEIERVLALGATQVNDLRNGERGWMVLADPEGNEFCILTPYQPGSDPDDGQDD